MITNSSFNLFITRARLLLVALMFAVVGSCSSAPKKAEKKSITELIPRKVAVLPSRFAEKGKKTGLFFEAEFEKEHFVADLVRGVINNQLPGRGYLTQPLDQVEQLLKSSKNSRAWHQIPPEKLCERLGVDGIVYPEILSFSMISAGKFNFYKIDARLKIINSSGKNLGTWSESAVQRQVLTPTGLTDPEPTFQQLVMDESVKKHMRFTVYDWGWKISQIIPERRQRVRAPEVVSVETNIDKGTYTTGDLITIEVGAEKGLACTFDIGGFKKDIPMLFTENGTYKGIYLVREGDRASSERIVIHLMRPDGMMRAWVEPAGTVNIK
jgi:hypothetical protein